MSVASPIVRAVRIVRQVDRSVFDLHLACGHVLVAEVFGDDRDTPRRGWRAVCRSCGRGDAAQPESVRGAGAMMRLRGQERRSKTGTAPGIIPTPNRGGRGDATSQAPAIDTRARDAGRQAHDTSAVGLGASQSCWPPSPDTDMSGWRNGWESAINRNAARQGGVCIDNRRLARRGNGGRYAPSICPTSVRPARGFACSLAHRGG